MKHATNKNIIRLDRTPADAPLPVPERGARWSTVYQPIYHLNGQDCDIWGYEILVRPPPPDQHLGAWEVLKRLRGWEEHFYLFKFVFSEAVQALKSGAIRHRITVNVEPTLFGARLEHFIRAVLEENRVDPSQVILEVTERVSIFEIGEGAVTAVKNLIMAGISIFIDDFFAGCNTLEHLLRLDVAGVKIDGRLVDAVIDRPKAFHILKSFNEMLASCQIMAITEGIETEMHRDIAMSAGSTLGQGYFCGRPAPLVPQGIVT